MGTSALKFQKPKLQVPKEGEGFPQEEGRGRDQRSLHVAPEMENCFGTYIQGYWEKQAWSIFPLPTLAQNTYNKAWSRAHANSDGEVKARRILLRGLDCLSASKDLGDIQEGALTVTKIKHRLAWYAEGLL